MTRTHASAKAAGTRFETQVADYLHRWVDERIERRTRNGAKDRGDIAGLRSHGARITVEVKNCARTDLAGWATEAEVERGNDDAIAGVIVHKRHGKGAAEDQWVTMTLHDFVALLRGVRPRDES